MGNTGTVLKDDYPQGFSQLKQSMDRQIVTTFLRIFDPLRVKISTLPPLCFRIYYIFLKFINNKNSKFQKKNLSPFWAWPLGTLRVCP